MPERNPSDTDQTQKDQRNVQVRLSTSFVILKQELGQKQRSRKGGQKEVEGE